MIDIETMGTEVDAAIVAIAAYEWDDNRAVQLCNILVDWIGAVKYHDRSISPETVRWWMQQSTEVQQQAINQDGRVPLIEALGMLADCLPDDMTQIWSKSPSFDLLILRCSYVSLRMPTPWKYYQERDVRTLISLNQNELSNNNHIAISDCVNQIIQCQGHLKNFINAAQPVAT